MRVHVIACLADNYAYVVETADGAIVVDPSEATPVADVLRSKGLKLRAILCTHHHLDHVGGVVELARGAGGVDVVAHRLDGDRIDGVTRVVEDGDDFAIGALPIRALHVPGHTRAAVTYVVGDARASDPPWAFTGDTLFLAGCGRLFEGTAEQMHRSLNVVLGGLDDATRVACGHEYTVANLRFAQHVEPENEAIAARLAREERARESGRPTVPGTFAEERATNPFLRVTVPAVRAHVAHAGEASDALDPVTVLARLREEKNSFR